MHYIKAKGIFTSDYGINIYRGCTHGCIYCDSRSEIYQINHKFEDIEVKENAAELLKKELIRRKPFMVTTGAMTDPYVPIEKRLQHVRKCLELIYRYGYGFSCLTKSDLILRDLDLLKKINEKTKAVVQITITTTDDELCKKIEPNVCPASRRLEVLRRLNENDIPAIVWLCPILPFINDTADNLTGILKYCAEAGVKGILCFGMGMTLREGNREYYYAALDRHFPGLKEKYVSLYGNSYELASPDTARLMNIFRGFCRANGIMYRQNEIFAYLNEFPDSSFEQTCLW